MKNRWIILLALALMTMGCSQSPEDLAKEHCECIEENHQSAKDWQDALKECRPIVDEIKEKLKDDEEELEKILKEVDECSFGIHIQKVGG